MTIHMTVTWQSQHNSQCNKSLVNVATHVPNTNPNPKHYTVRIYQK